MAASTYEHATDMNQPASAADVTAQVTNQQTNSPAPSPPKSTQSLLTRARSVVWLTNLSFVLLGVLIAYIYGKIAQRQGDRSLKAVLYGDCIDHALGTPFSSNGFIDQPPVFLTN
ncbi:uncharacterized protein KY384_000137 [Bacidia gigantensis]|uniref:uncharacterized protein n=1 Tax=Bacidia gigantensis TaxID=2732470 RepID=UPI001D047621|nr:uncharacterized protein KY384_000137 [Bacidia gigantensis]KAG8526144.1 hypothetical protein KY384_000137 [Bacidia gigantensis]